MIYALSKKREEKNKNKDGEKMMEQQINQQHSISETEIVSSIQCHVSQACQ